ncbi:hypothetical protein EMIHUDRAFT_60855, partial [Emiliania huxleyi CCMP1516]|uniref:Myosin motor domain-containing protein n=2 Tax=Emiliania huxleyi TaxID=2903 RepID=A0A0D3I9Y4_EMIH1
EAFGNASTGRNSNSSRFGKLIEVHYSSASASASASSSAASSATAASSAATAPSRICGARIVDFLLERTRVTGAAAGEGNFHIL